MTSHADLFLNAYLMHSFVPIGFKSKCDEIIINNPESYDIHIKI